MYVDLTVFGAVKTFEFGGEILGGGVEIVGSACVIRKVIGDWFFGNFLLEEIGLVEEQDD